MTTNRPMPLVGGAWLPLAFIACGLGALLAAVAWLAVAPALALQPHMHPHVVALAHVWLPGFLLSVCFGATYQLAPVVLGEPLAWERVTWGHLGLHVIGLPLLVSGFISGNYGWVAGGGVLVAAGALLFAANIIVAFSRSKRRDAIGWSLPLASGWLALTVLAGLALATSRLGVTLPVSPLALLRAHAHIGFVGFFLTLIQGVAFQLVPMFTLGDVRKPWRIAAGLAGSQMGLSLLALGLGWAATSLTIVGAAVLTVGLGLSGIELVETFRARRKRVLDPGLKAFACGAGLLVMAAVGGWALLAAGPSVATLRGALAYGIVIVAGTLSLMVLGMLCKIVPFLVWMRAYGSLVGRRPVPPAHTLGRAAWERTWLVSHLAGVLALAVGVTCGAQWTVRIGAWLMAAGVAFFCANGFRIAAHLRTKRPPGKIEAPAVLSPQTGHS